MTATLQPESKATSRRALLAGALGGIGALAATVIGRASPVHATDGQSALLGTANTSNTVTRFENVDSGETSLLGIHAGSGTGVSGVSSTGIGVSAASTTAQGVYAESTSDSGVFAVNSATTSAANVGWASTSTGVEGASGTTLPGAKAKTGVYGYADQDNTANGVFGESPAGRAIVGYSSSGYAGYFSGRVFTSKWLELGEVATPSAPSADRARLFVRDSGGKTQLCVRYNTGAVQVLNTQP